MLSVCVHNMVDTPNAVNLYHYRIVNVDNMMDSVAIILSKYDEKCETL